MKWNMFIPFIYSNSILCTYYPFHCQSLEYRIVDFDFIIAFAQFTLTLIHCHISCTIIFSLSIEVALSLLSFLCPSSTSFTIRDIMFIGYYVLLIWQTIISKEKSKNHFKHRLSRWKLPADTATAIFSRSFDRLKTIFLIQWLFLQWFSVTYFYEINSKTAWMSIDLKFYLALK